MSQCPWLRGCLSMSLEHIHREKMHGVFLLRKQPTFEVMWPECGWDSEISRRGGSTPDCDAFPEKNQDMPPCESRCACRSTVRRDHTARARVTMCLHLHHTSLRKYQGQESFEHSHPHQSFSFSSSVWTQRRLSEDCCAFSWGNFVLRNVMHPRGEVFLGNAQLCNEDVPFCFREKRTPDTL